MQIDSMGINAQMDTRQSTYDSVKSAADAEQFARVLQEEEKKLTTKEATPQDVAKAAAKDKKLKEACEGFEAMFLDLMYSKMRETVPDNDLFGNSNSDKILQSMLDSEMMKRAAGSGGVGLADMLYKQLKHDQQTVSAEKVTGIKK